MSLPPTNTYSSQEYTYAQLGDVGSVSSCSDITSFVGRFSNTLRMGGWNAGLTPHILEVTISKDDNFQLCTLGYSNFVFWVITVGSANVGVFDSDSTDPGNCCEGLTEKMGDCFEYMAANGLDAWILYEFGNKFDRFSKIREGITVAYGLNLWTIKWSGDVVETEDSYTIRGLMYFSGEPSGCPPTLSLGNQLVSVSQTPKGFGCLGKTQDGILDTNNATFYLLADPDNTFPQRRLQTGYRLGNFEDFVVNEISVEPLDDNWETVGGGDLSEIKMYFVEISGNHPYLEYLEEIDEVPNVDDRLIRLDNFASFDIDYEMWANPYGFSLHKSGTPDSNDAYVCLFIIKPKPLFGEDPDDTDTWLIRRGVFYCAGVGDNLTRANYIPEGSRIAVELTATGADTVKKYVAAQGTQWGVALFNIYSVRSSANIDDISWITGEAEIAEPWVACNFYTTSNYYAPIIGQLWDMVTVSRSLDIGYNNPRALFVWDRRLWRYFLCVPTSSPLRNTVGSRANVVYDGRIYNGSTRAGDEDFSVFSGPILADIDSVQVSPNPIPRGNSVSITFTISSTHEGFIENGVAQRELMVYFWFEGTNRIAIEPNDQVVVWESSDSVVKELTFSVIDLEVEESAQLYVQGESSRSLVNIIFA